MNGTSFLKNKLLEATIRNALFKEKEKRDILFDTVNSVLGTCDCYFSSKKLLNILNKEFTLKNGLCFAINYSNDKVMFRAVLNRKYLQNDDLFELLVSEYPSESIEDRNYFDEYVICSHQNDNEEITKAISSFFETRFNDIESTIISHILKIVKVNELKEMHEGEPISVELNKYERNREARLLCIKHYGAKCAICGFDFGKVYGDEFKGMIEVHHKKPLYEIKKDYIVDPINDLIPVCPNCHSAIHSKENGFYTIEEMKEKFSEKNKK